jgi:predicted ATPase
MINSFKFENFGPLTNVCGQNLGPINVFIGPNSSGKTFLLKAVYTMIRAQEETGRGDDPRDFGQVLSDKLYWTFQTDKLGDLVQKGTGKRLKATLTQDDNCSLVLDFGPDTQRKVVPVHNNLAERKANTIFLPPKEVLSLAKVILKSALQDKSFGFDATYVDLVLALQNTPQMGRNFDAFKRSRKTLEDMFQGKIEYQADAEKWVYRQGNSRFSIHVTAEGIKKIAILDTLLGNRYLSRSSIVIIDEPESALHPTAISQLLDIIEQLASAGIQFFIATHSYFVIKKLYLLALKHRQNMPTLVANQSNEWRQYDMLDGIPDNEIINESIRIFDAELEIVSP